MIEFRRIGMIEGVFVFGCEDCGAVVQDHQVHSDWHKTVLIRDSNKQKLYDQEEELSE